MFLSFVAVEIIKKILLNDICLKYEKLIQRILKILLYIIEVMKFA